MYLDSKKPKALLKNELFLYLFSSVNRSAHTNNKESSKSRGLEHYLSPRRELKDIFGVLFLLGDQNKTDALEISSTRAS